MPRPQTYYKMLKCAILTMYDSRGQIEMYVRQTTTIIHDITMTDGEQRNCISDAAKIGPSSYSRILQFVQTCIYARPYHLI